MHIAELALGALVGWSALGLAGVTLSGRRGERAKARRGLAWIMGVWIAYLAILLTVSSTQAQRRLAPGQEQCFGTVCYAVIAAEELPGFVGRGPLSVQGSERLLRISVRISNRAPAGLAAQPAVRAFLLDRGGRFEAPVPGLSGVRLDGPVLAGSAVVSQPVFRVPEDPVAISLVLTRGRWQPTLLEIGDPDSWHHPPVLLQLPLTSR